jgi:CheY-like chemotaxis protein
MPTESASLTVLVIDDEPLIRWALSEALAQAGHTVVEAPDGNGGLRAVMTAPCPFDVFLDFRLPDSNDFRLLHAIRTWAPRSAVVLMTASGTPELVVDAYRLGAYKVLDKPFDIARGAERRVCGRFTGPRGEFYGSTRHQAVLRFNVDGSQPPRKCGWRNGHAPFAFVAVTTRGSSAKMSVAVARAGNRRSKACVTWVRSR